MQDLAGLVIWWDSTSCFSQLGICGDYMEANGWVGGKGVFLATQNSMSQVLTNFSFGGRGLLANSKLKVTSSDQIFTGEGDILGNSKLKVPSPDQFFIGGGGYFWSRIRYSTFYSPKLAPASQIVSHGT